MYKSIARLMSILIVIMPTIIILFMVGCNNETISQSIIQSFYDASFVPNHEDVFPKVIFETNDNPGLMQTQTQLAERISHPLSMSVNTSRVAAVDEFIFLSSANYSFIPLVESFEFIRQEVDKILNIEFSPLSNFFTRNFDRNWYERDNFIIGEWISIIPQWPSGWSNYRKLDILSCGSKVLHSIGSRPNNRGITTFEYELVLLYDGSTHMFFSSSVGVTIYTFFTNSSFIAVFDDELNIYHSTTFWEFGEQEDGIRFGRKLSVRPNLADTYKREFWSNENQVIMFGSTPKLTIIENGISLNMYRACLTGIYSLGIDISSFSNIKSLRYYRTFESSSSILELSSIVLTCGETLTQYQLRTDGLGVRLIREYGVIGQHNCGSSIYGWTGRYSASLVLHIQYPFSFNNIAEILPYIFGFTGNFTLLHDAYRMMYDDFINSFRLVSVAHLSDIDIILATFEEIRAELIELVMSKRMSIE